MRIVFIEMSWSWQLLFIGNHALLLRTPTLFLDMLCIGEHIRFFGYVNQWNMYNMHMAIGVIYEIEWLIFTITSSGFCNEWIVSLEYIGFFFTYLIPISKDDPCTYWRDQIETFPASPGDSTVTGEFDVFSDLRLNTWLSKQSKRRWFKMPLRSL